MDFADRYDCKSQLGTGGNGVVYVAYDRVLRTDVALKLLSAASDTLAVREASALRALRSDHILPVLNAGVHNDVPFIVTEIAPGGSVEAQVGSSTHGVDVSDALLWTRHALIGLDYCHRRGVLHRDLTPNNIFLDSAHHARLGDFGSATNLHEGAAPRAGNQRVVAPEALRTGSMTVTSEVYSAGVCLWRMLTGAWPFEAPDEATLLMDISRGRRLRDAAPHVPGSVARVIEAAISESPDGRPATAAELRERLGSTTLSARAWARRQTHAGHEMCWRGSFPAGAAETCVIRTGPRAEVETRRMSGQRISGGCWSGPRQRLLPALRAIFDRL